MYKLLLCWRYLRTRYIALASVVSVTLGVWAMIVVNSVMAGFSSQMQDRIHGILSDLTFEARSMEGMRDAQWHMGRIRETAGDWIDGMTATVVVPGMIQFQYGGTWITRQVQVIGIDEKTQSAVSDFSGYLQHPANRREMSFQLREDGYDVLDHQAGPEAHPRDQMEQAGWKHRRAVSEIRNSQPDAFRAQDAAAAIVGPPPGSPAPARKAGQSPQQKAGPAATNPFAERLQHGAEGTDFDPAKEQCAGVVLGIAMASFRTAQGKDTFLVLPGDDVRLFVPTAAVDGPPKESHDNFTVVDFYESKMAEYDSNFVFVPIGKLQEMRGMVENGKGLINSIQIKLKPGVDGNMVRDKLRAAFPMELYAVHTWRDKQGALLAAVQMETTILNILLFFIIAVAGFGILAIFYMIVVEKTRDIGILKSLGAPGRGVMGIFLSYGLLLGLVGSGAGLFLGLLFVRYINQIADVLSWITGRPLFNPEIYYFYKIPTIVNPETIAWIVAGALSIAVLASILPARRAARLHPVEALRYE
ncbi:MAG: FtsX-like permease family protein [Thermoguttaceae bacterium]|jgi:lipoprotein-releasing system permease protein